LDGVDGDRLNGGQAGRLAGGQREGRAVQPALDLAVHDLALGQRDVRVRADVVYGVDLALAGAHDGDRGAVDVHRLGLVLLEVGHRADRVPHGFTAHAIAPVAGALRVRASSASTFSISRSSTSEMPICEITSA